MQINMNRLGISEAHRRQLVRQSAVYKRQTARNGVAPGPIVAAPAHGPQPESIATLPAKQLMPQQPKQTKQQQSKIRHLGKRRALMKSLATQPWDVRALVAVEEWVAEYQVRAVHFYVDVHKFMHAHSAGFCSLADRELRREKCSTCDSAYLRKGHGHCKSCNCGEWPASRRTHQTRLANFACPEKKFGRAHGWLPRLLHRVRLRRRSTDRR